MGMFKTLVSGTLALVVGILVLQRSIALDDRVILDGTDSVLPGYIHTCQDLLDTYDAAGDARIVRIWGDMTCAEVKVRSLLLYALRSAGAHSVCCRLY